MKKVLKYVLIGLAVIFVIGLINKGRDASTPTSPADELATGNQDDSSQNDAPADSGETDDAQPNTPPQPPSSNKSSIIIGIEYGFENIAALFSGLGIPAAKLLPEKFDWAKMQPSVTKPINWALSDDLIREYQDAGFREIVMGLRTQSHDSDNGATYGKKRPVPKPEYEDEYAAWVRGMVERYDKDGTDDMPGLRYPIRYYEIEVEFSSYTPESADEYLDKLRIAYKAAHDAYSGVIVAHSAFLPWTAFDENPSSGQYEKAFAAMRIPDPTHDLADMRKVLDHPELFDRVNFHALEDPVMLERAVTWLNYEMAQRGYKKPIIVSDTEATPFISYGNATSCTGLFLGIMVWPAKESDRCRLADYFNKILDGDSATLAWKNWLIAADTVKRVVIAAHSDVELIDTAFVTDLPILSTKLGFAAAGNGGFSGFITDEYNIFTKKHSAKEYRSVFYAVRQLAGVFSGTFTISREKSDADVRLYKIQNSRGTSWIGWVSPDYLVLQGDTEPHKKISLPLASGAAVTAMAKTAANPSKEIISSVGGQVTIDLSMSPVYIIGN